jgi:hypothetical protein
MALVMMELTGCILPENITSKSDQCKAGIWRAVEGIILLLIIGAA